MLSTEKCDELQSKRSFVSQIIELKRPSLNYLIIKKRHFKIRNREKRPFCSFENDGKD
jgi:hypothetical protein